MCWKFLDYSTFSLILLSRQSQIKAEGTERRDKEHSRKLWTYSEAKKVPKVVGWGAVRCKRFILFGCWGRIRRWTCEFKGATCQAQKWHQRLPCVASAFSWQASCLGSAVHNQVSERQVPAPLLCYRGAGKCARSAAQPTMERTFFLFFLLYFIFSINADPFYAWHCTHGMRSKTFTLFLFTVFYWLKQE